jgi:hypothetical protein
MDTLTITRLPFVANNDPRAIPCQQTFGECDQIARLHIAGNVDGNVWDVDVCPEHAGRVVANFGDVD